jgi:hypothetical protein
MRKALVILDEPDKDTTKVLKIDKGLYTFWKKDFDTLVMSTEELSNYAGYLNDISYVEDPQQLDAKDTWNVHFQEDPELISATITGLEKAIKDPDHEIHSLDHEEGQWERGLSTIKKLLSTSEGIEMRLQRALNEQY